MLRLGHRGASAIAPENTLAAFRQALAMGAHGVELDVHLCKSGEPVVIHDDTVDRTTDGSGLVAHMTLRELRALRLGGSEHIATLEEVLAVLAEAYCLVEIKHGDAALPAAELILHHAKKTRHDDRLWLISFKHEALVRALAVFPRLNIGMSYKKLEPSSIKQAHTAHARAVIPHHTSINAATVKEAHSRGLKIIGWTANESSEIARLKALGVDGIISDHPDRLAET